MLAEKHHSLVFRWAVRRLVRLGLWSESRRAKAARQREEITTRELEGRLAAYGEVAGL